MDQITTITVDDKQYDITAFSPEIIELVAVYRSWEAERAVQRAALLKTETAINSLASQLSAEIAKQIEEKGIVALEAPAQ